MANQSFFYVYQDQDSGLNHGFPSGFFGDINTVHVDTGCVDDSNDPNAVRGCAPPGSTILDRGRGNVMRITFDRQTTFAGLNIEDPENWGQTRPQSRGFDLTNVRNVLFDVRSPTGIGLQFGVGGYTTPYFVIIPASSTYKPMSIALGSMTQCSDTSGCDPLNSVHRLFVVATNSLNAPNGGTVLLDDIRFDPVPTAQRVTLGFPCANETFGVVPLRNKSGGRVDFPSDQVLRNLAPIYESAITEIALLRRGTPQDLAAARLIADTFDYALKNDNRGDPIKPASDGSVGLHNAYECGDIALYNDQVPPKLGKSGDVRLAGFSTANPDNPSDPGLCTPTGFCLVLDDATGGNNAFTILALLKAYRRFNDPRYLDDAREIGNWITHNLADTSGTGDGGYFVGYFGLNTNQPQILNRGKSTENNADIFAALSALADVEYQLRHRTEAQAWTAAAYVAGDFVMKMLIDPAVGNFNLGTVPTDSAPLPGSTFCPGKVNGSDTLNTCPFLDANTFSVLALATASRYRSQLDWRKPVRYVQNTNFAVSVVERGSAYQGFDIVPPPIPGPEGVAWEFTAQEVAAMRFVDGLYRQNEFEADIGSYPDPTGAEWCVLWR
jgi:hypothetical protein